MVCGGEGRGEGRGHGPLPPPFRPRLRFVIQKPRAIIVELLHEAFVAFEVGSNNSRYCEYEEQEISGKVPGPEISDKWVTDNSIVIRTGEETSDASMSLFSISIRYRYDIEISRYRPHYPCSRPVFRGVKNVSREQGPWTRLVCTGTPWTWAVFKRPSTQPV